MFGLRQQIKLKQGKNALRDGRLDEAYAIATDEDVREFRGGQVLLENLVNPLLDRAEQHLGEGRLQDALIDVERAIVAGGNRPRTARLKLEVRQAIDRRRHDEEEARGLLSSVRRHLERGSLHAGKELLDHASGQMTGVERLRRAAVNRERCASEAVERALTFLESGEIEEALAAARRAVEAHEKDPRLPELLVRLKRDGMKRLQEALASGNLKLAAGITDRLRPLFGTHLELSTLDDAMAFTRKAGEAVGRGDFEEARIALGRVAKLLPDTTWVAESLAQLDTVLDGVRTLKTGPLGLLATATGRREDDSTQRVTRPALAATAVERRADVPGRRHGALLLWIDGIGTYLVLTSDRVTIGRSGSSARPDVALAADIAGHHAEVLRVEEDYFIVPAEGTVRIGGAQVDRKLLASGDRIDLGKSCRLVFHQPTSMSTTAVISLHKGHRIEKDVRKVILLDRDLVVGPRSSCHIQAPVGKQPLVLSYRHGQLHCRASDAVSIDGKPVSDCSESRAAGPMPVVNEVPVPLGAHVRVGDLTFTVTTPEGGGRT